MDATAVRAWCLRQPRAIEDFPFGPETSAFKVAGEIFAISALDRTPLQVSVKCERELGVALRRSYPAIRPGYHFNNRHWNTRAGAPIGRRGQWDGSRRCHRPAVGLGA
jgi:predicted DNA-binding protein (MmcQ/YjbR family)